ncbi:acyl-CoA dehydrogenase family protein [Blastococcus capsensis]|uniref:acyl-CoA dehydrogenase family protein n=1 Tax=Blastococcus capsensis TaxID=1564163 RepID=UPI00253FE4F0|nr:acyl-CoA dehydrogenase family protein [Blastococcus capsensis]MDK3258486.1 acyl-CoA dehydrogenase family protein [Blastococcus capsensis]
MNAFHGVDLPPELRSLYETVGRFVHDEISPAEAGLDPTARALPDEVLVPLQEKARRSGFWCMDAPAELGGGGLSTFEMTLVWEQASRHRFAFPVPGGGVFGYSPPVPLYRGSRDQIDRFVRPTIERGLKTFTAISEPSGGSDPARAMRTTATRRGDRYVLNGRKMWSTNADEASFGVIYARTDPARGRKGISAFVVESGTPGMQVSPVPVMRNHWTTEIALDGCEIPVENRIGAEGEGFALAERWMVRGRLMLAAQALGVAAEAIAMAVAWAKERETFGALLATRQGIQFPLADSLVELNAARLLTWQAARKDDAGQDARLDASMAKLYSSEMGFRVVDRAIQILGGMGLSKELNLEHWFRDLRTMRVVEGGSEIQRFLIARDMLGSAAMGRPAADGRGPAAGGSNP